MFFLYFFIKRIFGIHNSLKLHGRMPEIKNLRLTFCGKPVPKFEFRLDLAMFKDLIVYGPVTGIMVLTTCISFFNSLHAG